MSIRLLAAILFSATFFAPTSALALPATNADVSTVVRPGETAAVVAYDVPVDSTPGAVVTCAPASTSSFPVGETVVTCNGEVPGVPFCMDPPLCTVIFPGAPILTGTSTFKVNVIADTVAPTIASKADVTAAATGASGTAVTYDVPAVTDNAPAPSAAYCLPASGSTFAIGTTTVGCFASDRFGRVGTSTFNVVVTDKAAPQALVVPTFATKLTATEFSIPLVMQAMCSEACKVAVKMTVAPSQVGRTGRTPIALASATKQLAADAPGRLTITAPVAARRTVAASTRDWVLVKLQATVTDAAGNSRVALTHSFRVAS